MEPQQGKSSMEMDKASQLWNQASASAFITD